MFTETNYMLAHQHKLLFTVLDENIQGKPGSLRGSINAMKKFVI